MYMVYTFNTLEIIMYRVYTFKTRHTIKCVIIIFIWIQWNEAVMRHIIIGFGTRRSVKGLLGLVMARHDHAYKHVILEFGISELQREAILRFQRTSPIVGRLTPSSATHFSTVSINLDKLCKLIDPTRYGSMTCSNMPWFLNGHVWLRESMCNKEKDVCIKEKQRVWECVWESDYLVLTSSSSCARRASSHNVDAHCEGCYKIRESETREDAHRWKPQREREREREDIHFSSSSSSSSTDSDSDLWL